MNNKELIGLIVKQKNDLDLSLVCSQKAIYLPYFSHMKMDMFMPDPLVLSLQYTILNQLIMTKNG